MDDGDTMDEALLRLGSEPERWALFLDIDGTLLDLAPTPDLIEVPSVLPEELLRLSGKLGGALALVTGRALIYADELFQPCNFPIAGLHGAEMRGPDGHAIYLKAPPEFEALKSALIREAEDMPGILIEDKGAAVAAHYRLAPEYESRLETLMRGHVHEAGPDWALQLGKMVFEIRPARASKGDALQRFLQEYPFEERLPLAIGDDLTDESMFAAANARGGHSICVGRRSATCALSYMPSPASVRRAIAALAA